MFPRLGLQMILLLLDNCHHFCSGGRLLSLGPLYGYYPNANKTYFIVKLQLYNSEKQLFQDNDIQVTCHSQRHLDAAIGSWLFTEEYVSKKVKTWSDELLTLSSISESYLIVLIVHLFMV